MTSTVWKNRCWVLGLVSYVGAIQKPAESRRGSAVPGHASQVLFVTYYRPVTIVRPVDVCILRGIYGGNGGASYTLHLCPAIKTIKKTTNQIQKPQQKKKKKKSKRAWSKEAVFFRKVLRGSEYEIYSSFPIQGPDVNLLQVVLDIWLCQPHVYAGIPSHHAFNPCVNGVWIESVYSQSHSGR